MGSRSYFHVTPMQNVPSIMKNGLVPQIGERSGAQGEETPAVYLFPTKEDMDNALSNWLGDWFEDVYGPDVELAVIKVSLPKSVFVHYDSDVLYECYVTEPISPKQMFYFTENGEPLHKSLGNLILDASSRQSVLDPDLQYRNIPEIRK